MAVTSPVTAGGALGPTNATRELRHKHPSRRIGAQNRLRKPSGFHGTEGNAGWGTLAPQSDSALRGPAGFPGTGGPTSFPAPAVPRPGGSCAVRPLPGLGPRRPAPGPFPGVWCPAPAYTVNSREPRPASGQTALPPGPSPELRPVGGAGGALLAPECPSWAPSSCISVSPRRSLWKDQAPNRPTPHRLTVLPAPEQGCPPLPTPTDEYPTPSSGPWPCHPRPPKPVRPLPGCGARVRALLWLARPSPQPLCLPPPPSLPLSPRPSIVCSAKAGNPRRGRGLWAAEPALALLPGAHLYAEGIRRNLLWLLPGLLAP